MRSFLAHPYKPSPLILVALIAGLALLLPGWTCSAIFLSCQGWRNPKLLHSRRTPFQATRNQFC